MKLKTGDKVVVITGANKGKEGKITKVLDDKVIVEGVNVCKKHLKPKKNGRFQQGYINPNSCKKLFESVKNQPIIYRSSWEKRFIYWCESNKNVKYWGSECTCIKDLKKKE